LPKRHKWLTNRHKFNGKVEKRDKPNELTNGNAVFAEMARLPMTKYGKINKRSRAQWEYNWTKKSIFFELPYWKDLMIRRIFYAMHIEKNICDNIIGMLLNIEGKNKDIDKVRKDLTKKDYMSRVTFEGS
jgi:hypothetical protein